MEMEMEIKHLSHKHPLRLEEVTPTLYVQCAACGDCTNDDQIYECRLCNYRLDKRCIDLPKKFLNRNHPHTLYAEPHKGIEVTCSSCCKKVQPAFFYRCQYCNLNLDVKCAFCESNRAAIHHISHFHPLELDYNYKQSCFFCPIEQGRMSNPGQSYNCWNCRFKIHLQCSELELPQEIQHPRHPCLLTLCTNSSSFVYRCNNCKFETGAQMALSLIKDSKGEERFYHFSHRHLLELTELNNEDDQVNCSACGKSCSAPTYGCIPCQFFLHQSCVDLPLEIQHFFHPCPLTLRIQPNSFNCGACERTIQGFYFYCKWCNFSLDIECAMLPTIKSQIQEQIFHFSHGHPLTLSEIRDDDKISCSACRRCCSGSAFVCRYCSFSLDKSCFELPRELQYFLHPRHPLTLLGKPTNLKSVCDGCCKNLNGLTYRCELCNFSMHLDCTMIMPTISYQGHNHLLLFLDNIDTEVKCNSCDTLCNSSVFHCIECNFNLHLHCGPLPSKIKHDLDYDLLDLTSSPVEDESDEFYCYSCEKERDPRLPIYYCEDCHFAAELKCVLPEVIRVLKGEYGPAELRNPQGKITGKVIIKTLKELETEQKEEQNSGKEIKAVLTLDDLLISFNEDENKEIKGIQAAAGRDIVGAGETSDDIVGAGDQTSDDDSEYSKVNDHENMELNDASAVLPRSRLWSGRTSSNDQREDTDGSKLEVSMFSEEAYTDFMEKLDSCTDYSSMKLWDENDEVAEMGDNMVTRKLAPMLQDLCARYGNIGAESTLSPRVKTYFTVMLCGTIQSMCNTRDLDISEDVLLTWWNNLKSLKFAGFKVQFGFDHLEKVSRAYFGLQVKGKADNRVVELDREITKLLKESEEIARKIEALRGQRESITSAESSKSSVVKECLIEASNLKWWPASTGLL